MFSTRHSIARVLHAYIGKYDIISLPRPLPDRYYWGFEGEDGGMADEGAKALSRLVQQSNARMETLGRKVWQDIQNALQASGGVNTPMVHTKVTSAIIAVRAFARVEWAEIGDELLSYRDVDADPRTSRIACAIGFKHLYRQLGERVTHPAAADLRVLYFQLMDQVGNYFDKL